MLITVIICLTTNCTSNSLIKELFVELLDRLLTSIHIPEQHIVRLLRISQYLGFVNVLLLSL